MNYRYPTLVALFSIVVVGIIAIPIGNPRFLDRAIVLELSFIVIFALVWKGYNKAYYPCIAIAVLVMIGNSLSSTHVALMMTFAKPLNAIVLIIGGYVLQLALLFFSLKGITGSKPAKISKPIN